MDQMCESMDKNRIQGVSAGRAGNLPRSPYPSRVRSVEPAAVHRRRLNLPQEICSVSLRRLRLSKDGLTAEQKSAEGEAQSAMAGGSGTRYSSCDFTVDDARAISTALAAQLSTPSSDRSSVAAQPNPPLERARLTLPHKSESEAPAILPFLVASERLRSSTMRASA